MKSIIHGLLRISLIGLAGTAFGLTSIVVLWFAANRLLDESALENPTNFSVTIVDHRPDRQNIAVALLGLTAPKDKDFIEYGSDTADLFRARLLVEAWDKMLGPDTLQLTVERDQIDCWSDPYNLITDSCLPLETAPEVLGANSLLLQRYKSLQQLDHYANPHTFFRPGLLDMVKLVIAEIYLDLERGETRAAYLKWRDQMRFSKRILAGVDGRLGKSVARVQLMYTLSALEHIIRADPGLAGQFETELLSLLRFDGIKDFNSDGILQNEHALLKFTIENPPVEDQDTYEDRFHWLLYHFGQRQRILNRYLAFADDYSKATRLPWPRIEQEMSKLAKKHAYSSLWDVLVDPFGTMQVGEFVDSMVGDFGMYTHKQMITARMRLASLMIRLVSNDVNAEDIPDFIETAGPDYYSPFTNRPMLWNAQHSTIYFADPRNQCHAGGYFHVPSSNDRADSPKPRMNLQLC